MEYDNILMNQNMNEKLDAMCYVLEASLCKVVDAVNTLSSKKDSACHLEPRDENPDTTYTLVCYSPLPPTRLTAERFKRVPRKRLKSYIITGINP